MKFLEKVRIPEQALKYPGQLSGGQHFSKNIFAEEKKSFFVTVF